ncbi:MAG: hyporthetical protein [Cyanobacteria bacterium RYN_339]|nr:hyporthetical protein [Cyanobacteria bacterium RYN_339]
MPTQTLQTVIDRLVELAPPHLAAAWDNVGLMVGDPGRILTGVAVAVDPTLAAVDATIAAGANLLVTHHPLLFKAPKSLDLRKEPGRTLERLIKADVGLYAAHTNLDVTAVNEALATTLGLKGHRVLDVSGERPTYKVAVYVPVAELERVRLAAWEAGAGRSAGYDRGAYALAATGTFRPRPGANPAEGHVGEQVVTSEARLEFVCGQLQLKTVRAAIVAAHPYEEPAIEVFPLHGAGEPYGFGLVGDLPAPEPLGAFARRVAGTLGTTTARFVGPADRPIKRVAWMGGSAGDYWPQALAAGCDAYITGEVRHHAALDGLAAGMAFVEVGHVGSEQPVVPFLVDFLGRALGGGVPVLAIDQLDPFTTL